MLSRYDERRQRYPARELDVHGLGDGRAPFIAGEPLDDHSHVDVRLLAGFASCPGAEEAHEPDAAREERRKTLRVRGQSVAKIGGKSAPSHVARGYRPSPGTQVRGAGWATVGRRRLARGHTGGTILV